MINFTLLFKESHDSKASLITKQGVLPCTYDCLSALGIPFQNCFVLIRVIIVPGLVPDRTTFGVTHGLLGLSPLKQTSKKEL